MLILVYQVIDLLWNIAELVWSNQSQTSFSIPSDDFKETNLHNCVAQKVDNLSRISRYHCNNEHYTSFFDGKCIFF